MYHFLTKLLRRDDGMTTAEYAIGTVAAAAFAGVLYAILTDGAVVDQLATLISDSLGKP
ncbi:DUF4244 domain-containing protein [Actinokineospora soli]|uniref:DUF4244 domain-containing protein n=1 Tax=Actinokineospora soli TaxID=1048753 RepID=A0ABW2THJ8_9PSEU